MSIRESGTSPQDSPPTSGLLVAGESGRGVNPWFVVVMLWGASGIALLLYSFALARANLDLDIARPLFWIALAAIAGSALLRILARSTGRSERIALVALTALLFYWVKVLHDPTRLMFPDEFFHLANAERLLQTGELYGENLMLPVSADYPGLVLVTGALSELSGLGIFPCAVFVVGLAKVLLSVALFLIFERVSGSARIAGVGALFYCAHSNYLFWSSQFSYESLSVPLLAVALLCVVARNGESRAERNYWSALGCLVALAVVVTHHLTGYILAAILWAQVVLALWWRRGVRPPIAMAVVATTAAAVWATTVAGGTGDYLGFIFGRLLRSISQAASDVGTARVPFEGGAPGEPGTTGPPLDDQLLAGASVLLVALGVFAGLYAARRRQWMDPLAVILAVAAAAAVAAYPLRVLSGAWEVSNRTSAFLFIGVAAIAAVGAVAFVDAGRGRWRVPLITLAGVVAIAGGCVLGWPSDGRLPRPFTAQVDGARIKSQGPQLADWAGARLPRAGAFVADDTNSRLLSAAGFARVSGGSTRAVPQLLSFDVIPQWQWDYLRDRGIDYVVVDRRVASTDNVIGYFYPRPSDADGLLIPNWLNLRRKYENLPGSARIFDSGDIVIYDIRRPLQRPKAPVNG